MHDANRLAGVGYDQDRDEIDPGAVQGKRRSNCDETKIELDQAFQEYAHSMESEIFGLDIDSCLREQPGSMVLDDTYNQVLRIPTRKMQVENQVNLNRMLCEIRSKPEEFEDMVYQRRRSLGGYGALASEPQNESDDATECNSDESCVEHSTLFCCKDNKLDDYEIGAVSGKGSFSVVYAATCKADGMPVALKRIDLDGITPKEARVKCLKETRLLCSLKHPNVIQLIDSFSTKEGLFIVLEWAAAGDLKNILRRVKSQLSRLHEDVIWSYFVQIMHALEFIHSHRIIHRDVKPSNIFITESGQVKLGDLGISRKLSQTTVKAYSKVGTPLYVAPEILRGCGHCFKTDIWGAGCVLYELAMLHSPFEVGCKTIYNLFSKIMHAEYTPLSRDFSDFLCNIVDQTLSIDPSARPCASELIERTSHL